MPLGGHDAEATIEAFNRHKKELRARVAHRINLKFAPDLRFSLDPAFDAQARIDVLLKSPSVARDLDRRQNRNHDEAMIRQGPRASGVRLGVRAKAWPRVNPRPKRSTRVEVDGWINLDKPIGDLVDSGGRAAQILCSTPRRRATPARSTRSPSGVLPVAFGEATKTVPIVQDGAKVYQFRVRWGEESATDDAEGEIVARCADRPSPAEIAALLPRFVGVIEQVPPTYSAIKIEGARAYDLAREGEHFEIASRPIRIFRLDLDVGRGRLRPYLRPNAARALTCARSRATSAARSAATDMSPS